MADYTAVSRSRQTDRSAVRFALAGVSRVGFYNGGQRCPEDVPFPSCLRAILDYLDDGMGYRLISAHTTTWRLDKTFTYLMGISGCAFHAAWQPDWTGCDCNHEPSLDDSVAMFTRTFEGLGYSYTLIHPGNQLIDETVYRSAIYRSLHNNHRPLIAFGVIGPPEACLITGYDEGGDVLIGWNFYQDFPEHNSGVTFEPSGCFRKRGWFAHTHGLLSVGDTLQAPPPEHTDRSALSNALQMMRTPVDQTGEKGRRGHAAYQAWAADLLVDDAFPASHYDTLRARFLAHDKAVGTVAEGRWYAAKFMEMLAERYQDCEEELLSAAACFETEHDLMWKAWGLVGGSGLSDEHVMKLACPAVRREISNVIQTAQALDEQAAALLEQSVQHIG